MHVDNLPVGSLAAPPAGDREATPAQPVVTARQVTRTYGRTRALTGVGGGGRGGGGGGGVGRAGAG
ncbi:hypothetical protein, partial [Micromonospora sp. NPDC005197]|uniref:hypothetical protein n=1 Tax=Micromonospora sp. NPDC005197 TaxID=3157020 RepID=UPI0033A8BE5B